MPSDRGGDEDEGGAEDAAEFAECAFCGVSAAGGGEGSGGIDLDSAFVRSIGGAGGSAKQVEAEVAGEVDQPVKLRKCNRCLAVAYCSRECQRRDYRSHKFVCRQIGKEMVSDGKAQSRDGAPAGGELGGNAPSAAAASRVKADRSREGKHALRTNDAPPKKGVPAPLQHPRTSFVDKVKPALMNKRVVLHCASPYDPASGFMGVYSPFQRGPFSYVYIYDGEMTFNFFCNSARWSCFEQYGYNFDFAPNQDKSMLLQGPGGGWIFHTGAEESFKEQEVPRSRDESFWEDPGSLLYMSPSEVYSTWVEDTVHGSILLMGQPTRTAQIAITPLETLIKAAASAAEAPTAAPMKFRKAADFTTWDRSFVLHADPRSCQAPLDWIDTLTGVYTPINGKLLNGYPVWRRDCTSTSELVGAMPGPAAKHLESLGIRLVRPSSEKRLLCVRKDSRSSPSLLSVMDGGDFRGVERKQSMLVASHVPACVVELLTEPASLFTLHAKAFSTWKTFYSGRWIEIHVAFTPKEFFEQTITLANLDADLLGGDAAVGEVATSFKSKRKSRKKTKKKKKKPPANSAYVAQNSVAEESEKTADAENSAEPAPATKQSKSPAETEGPKPDAKMKPTRSQRRLKKNQKAGKQDRKPDAVEAGTDDKSLPSAEQPAIGAFDGSVAVDSVVQKTVNAVEQPSLDAPSAIKDFQDIELQIQAKFDVAPAWVLAHIASLVEADPSSIPSTSVDPTDLSGLEEMSVNELLKLLLEGINEPLLKMDPLWLRFDDGISSPILKAALRRGSCEWVDSNASELVILFSKRGRRNDLEALLAAGASITAAAVTSLMSSLSRGRGDQFNNKIVKLLCAKCTIILESSEEFGSVMHAASHIIGKATRKELVEALKLASEELQRSKRQQSREKKVEASKANDLSPENNVEKLPEKSVPGGEKVLTAVNEQKKAEEKIQAALSWYSDLLAELVDRAVVDKDRAKLSADDGSECAPLEDAGGAAVFETTAMFAKKGTTARKIMTSDEVAAALSSCDSEELLADVETGIDLFQWDMSEWTIDITEQAHKWFQRHIKKDKALCERIIRRLTLLSTGRWPYVLCKPLRSKRIGSHGRKINLYETKIDSASRIIWEVAIAFSPRLSSLDQNFCEQVIRVWDIVLDHDNLSRAIEQTIERIEKSHLRGEDCAIYAELDRSHAAKSRPSKDTLERIPRVFPMSNELVAVGSNARGSTAQGKSRHFHPASEDPRQYTLLKFYELNSGAIKILLDGNDENMDLPFTPGPKEHTIIHHKSDPQRSILLMGRSGTGKTTCLVFRMWAQYAASGQADLRQLFLTKNDVLCREVERSFNNMGLAWRKRQVSSSRNDEREETDEGGSKLTKFMTSSEWLEALDVLLPGDSFFSPAELEQRIDDRKERDTVTRGVEALLSEESFACREETFLRQEITFITFRKLWRKIRSGSGSQMDSIIVWREIKSFIKGSVMALHVDQDDRSLPQNRFLSLGEYLGLPRKQSRMDESQRREVYDLYVRYEKLKREGFHYDECDLVYNIAGRISLLDSDYADMNPASILPVDSLFVDEVQDFTQAELYVLAKLCRNPNGLFLAGDTAQSIAVGVDFRFTDVRQIFFNHFGGIEPELLQLSHNYRSHAGVLRLAACVVELLYFFFSNSLDKLPPDLGLFSGPKPVIMEVSSTADLILMLDGAKRETSRIEFGAHQVVIVRSEEAKRNLPDEFGVDRDWVMTVQQSKGLEFDDVLLYNFFTDSAAKDAWRVVSNYTKDDIDNYYGDISVVSSGVQKYDWDDAFLGKTRHLDFNPDQHRILETELKMLYTAITRARVNVFIAETDVEASKPMFNYFQRRAVVDVVRKDKSNTEGLAGVRVFGVMNSVDDWRNRGEYYLHNAEGERQKGCLRLAAKCFDKSGDVKRRDFALAFLAFTEIEEEESSKKRGKQGIEWRAKLYRIAEQLLEARDLGFLNKAALCLLRTGDHNDDAARMFELYARICYARRMQGSYDIVSVDTHEKKYLSYAGKLFEKCVLHDGSKVLAMDSFRCYLCAGMYDDAARVLDSDAFPLQEGDTLEKLNKLCRAKAKRDPIAAFQRDFQNSAECILAFKQLINKKAKIGCRILSRDGSSGFSAALGLVSSRSDRIELLRSIDTSADMVLSSKPWSSHPTFVPTSKRVNTTRDDFTGMLIAELKVEQRHDELISIYEQQGFLLEAADQLEKSQNAVAGSSKAKALALRAKHVELMLLSADWKARKESLQSILDNELFLMDNSTMDVDTKCCSVLSSVLLLDDPTKLLSIVDECKHSAMWQNRVLQMAFETNSVEDLLAELPGTSVLERLIGIYKLSKRLSCLASALQKRNTRSVEENMVVAHAERYFELVPNGMDQSILETNPVTNSRLREALTQQQGRLSLQFLSSGAGFTQSIGRVKLHTALSKYFHGQAALLLLKLSELLGIEHQRIKRSTAIANVREYIYCLQLDLLCKKELSVLCEIEGRGAALAIEPWKRIGKISSSIGPVASLLLDIFSNERRVAFEINDGDLVLGDTQTAANMVVVKKSVIDAMYDSDSSAKLSMKTRKCDISHTITRWRLHSLCRGSDFANKSLHNDISSLERHSSTENDMKRGRRYYSINKRGQIYPRLWLWVVESGTVINSVSVAERIIKTSFTKGLTPLKRHDQLSLIEVNTVVLFASLSLRYSETDEPAPFLIPKYSYLRGLLAGTTGVPQIQGFGVPIKNLLSKYCHQYFDRVFEDVVAHLERSAAFILDNGLLSSSKSDDDGATEKAFILSAFICCNAVIFSNLGLDMDVADFKRDLSTLPSLPLQGNIRKLVSELQVQKAFSASSLVDLATCADGMLMSSIQDKFVVCRVKQQSEQVVDVVVEADVGQAFKILAEVPFDPDCHPFSSASKSLDFLDSIYSVHDEGDHGRKSEELNAVRVLARFAKASGRFTENADSAVMHFRRWKLAMRVALRILKKDTKNETDSVTDEASPYQDFEHGEDSPDTYCVLGQIFSPFQNSKLFHQYIETSKASYHHAVVDVFECTYCSIPFNPTVHGDRSRLWDIEGRGVPFPAFAQFYNMRHFNVCTSNPELEYHNRSPVHTDNVIAYMNKLDQLATVMARLRMGHDLLFQVAKTCNEAGRLGGIDSMWYYTTEEESRELLFRLQKAQGELSGAAIAWSRNPSRDFTWKILHEASGLPHHAETLFLKKRDEEFSMKESRAMQQQKEDESDSAQANAGEGVFMDPIEELMRGLYLNPEAATFIPASGF
ncbi:hypothetical protein ACHAWF_016289 [Thalassiosira exigua]